MKKPIDITIIYDDGSIDYAKNEHAQKVMSWWNSCETLAFVHGARYSGPKLISVPAAPEGAQDAK